MTSSPPPSSAPTSSAPTVPARTLLGSRKLWITPLILAGTLIALISLIYVGSVVDPTAHLHDLPVVVVDQDRGSTTASGEVNIGQQVVTSLESAPGVTSRLSLSTMTLADAQHRMDKGQAFATIVVPADFTASLLDLYSVPGASPASGRPTIEILTNQRAGSVGISLAAGVTEPALDQIMKSVSAKLTSAPRPARPRPPAPQRRAAPSPRCAATPST